MIVAVLVMGLGWPLAHETCAYEFNYEFKYIILCKDVADSWSLCKVIAI
jgi:hypothetical protein